MKDKIKNMIDSLPESLAVLKENLNCMVYDELEVFDNAAAEFARTRLSDDESIKANALLFCGEYKESLILKLADLFWQSLAAGSVPAEERTSGRRIYKEVADLVDDFFAYGNEKAKSIILQVLEDRMMENKFEDNPIFRKYALPVRIYAVRQSLKDCSTILGADASIESLLRMADEKATKMLSD